LKILFVYGSLLEGCFNYNKILKGKVVSNIPGKIRGILYHQKYKGYPALTLGDRWVYGELLEFKNFDEQIVSCDKLENYFAPGHPDNEYDRRVSEISLENKETLLAWVYWYARNDLKSDENPVIYIPSGNWREFMCRNILDFL
jgi:gamma-glutamylcyclotransferase (GGCT)/AIG2-like uncharacterized protein YtfP